MKRGQEKTGRKEAGQSDRGDNITRKRRSTRRQKLSTDKNMVSEDISIKFSLDKNSCMRECCRIKREVDRSLSRQKMKMHNRIMDLKGGHHNSMDIIESQKRPKKINSFGNSRLNTITIEDKKKTKRKVYLLPHLKQFQEMEVKDQQIDHQKLHKVCWGRKSRVLTDDNLVLPRVESCNKHTNTQEKQEKIVLHFDKEYEEKVNQSSYIDASPVKHLQESRNEKDKDRDTDWTNPSRPYYKYLQNYNKGSDKGVVPLRRALFAEPKQSNKLQLRQIGQTCIPDNKDVSTIFHVNKLRVSAIKMNSSRIIKNREFQVPKTEEEKSKFLIKYKPMQDRFNLKSLVKKDNFQIVDKDEEVYFGQIGQGVKHGNGILINKKEMFQGMFQNDLKVKGIQKTKVGTYKGTFTDGKRHGLGEFTWTNGQYFEGEWKQGKKEGHGIWKDLKGNHYEGQWHNNKQNGKGIYTYVGGSKYSGYFKDFLKHGRGEQQFANGDKYTGSYRQGKAHGYGKYIWVNGDIYEGDFLQGTRTGDGVLITSQGDRYDGQFQSDLKHGVGKQKYNNGQYFDGEFQGGQKVRGKLFSKKGQILSQLK